MPILDHLWIIMALPLLGAAINGLLGKNWSKPIVNAVGVGSVALAFLSAAEAIREFSQLSPDQIPWIRSYFTWITAGIFKVDFALQVDQLTVVMLFVVTFVGLLVHIYSTGYMAHEEGYYRFFACLNLFVFFMLTLVLAANVVLMFVGWEGVGLCSYLLIGFWFLKQSAISAGKKAFITTRLGDLGFTVGILLLFWTFHSVDFATIFKQAAGMSVEGFGPAGVLTIISLLLFIGAIGKSAQIPLYVWLPDAMEGPPPVSALIHAATMVTAGVYMVARMNPLFSRAPLAMFVVAMIGALTAFFAATIGLVQTDIKKVLAYSTVSQLGYMFLGLGVGAYASGVFHLMTHAFFKGLLFLAAGSVIHAMGGDQEMPHMGGLRTKIPITFWCMFIATLAIAGIPGFAGFFSKDEILEAAEHSNLWFYWLGLLGAGFPSFYMFRLIFLTFFGEPRYDEHKVHVHESPYNMTVPLILLAILSTVGGWAAAPRLVGGTDYFEKFLHPVFSMYAPAGVEGTPEAVEAPGIMLLHALTGWPVLIALAGLLIAWWFYIKSPQTPKKHAVSLRGLYRLVLHEFYVDELDH